MNHLSTRLRSMAGVLAAVGLTVAATAAATTGAALSASQSDSITIVALFKDASPIRAGNEVKAAGATVGYVDAIDLQNGLAKITMDVDSAVLPLHMDATATITEKDPLGERYIALERGNPAAPTLDGSPRVIPVAQTGRTVDLQDVLNSQDDPTSTALAALVTTLGEGADGQGPRIQAGIKALAPALRQADQLGQLLSDQNKTLTQLIDASQPVVGALAAGRGQKLDSFVDSTTQLLGTVQANRDATQASLQRLPGTLAAAQHTLSQVAGVSDAMTPTLAGMRPITDNLVDISGELRRFSDATDPAVASLRPVLDRGQQMLDELGPVAHDLRPAGPRARTLAAAGHEVSDKFLSGRLDNLMEWVKGWALITSGYDGVSHYFRAAVIASPKGLATTGLGPVPGAPQAQKLPNVFKPGVQPPPPVGPSDEPFEPGRDRGATGLTEQQENDMVGQLLGGH